MRVPRPPTQPTKPDQVTHGAESNTTLQSMQGHSRRQDASASVTAEQTTEFDSSFSLFPPIKVINALQISLLSETE